MSTRTKEEAQAMSSRFPKLPRLDIFKLSGIFQYVLPYKNTFIVGLLFLLLSTATTLVFPYIASLLADSAVGNNNWTISDIGKILLVVLILQGIFSYIRILTFSIVSEKAMAAIREQLYSKMITLNIGFFEQHRVGELSSRLANDVTQLQNAISINLAELLRQVFTLLVGIIVIAFTSLRLTLVMLSTFPVAVIAAMIFGKYIRRLSKQTQDALADANVVAEETLQGIQAVKSFTNEGYEASRYSSAMSEVVQLAIRAARYRGLFVSFLVSAVFGGIVLVLWYGATLVEGGSLTIGELLRFVLYTFFIGAALGGVGDLYSNMLKAVGAVERVENILEEPSEVDLQRPDYQPISGDIVYRDVSFAYPTRPDVSVLEHLSLHIGEGQRIAVVGHSGAGKSTIAQLLMRLYTPNSGEITIGGTDIQSMDLHRLRQNIGIVPQEVLLFGGTIAENIRYGKPNATDAEIEAAARQANAMEFIQRFPEGLQTVVGERGIRLSGGQRQRIAIARALLKNPRILILDEATSSLDAESEKLVQMALQGLMENRTTIIIAHRLGTIRHADCIYVIEEGKIVEQGTHDSLMQNQDGLYFGLLKLQAHG